jgi:hypothetical protein
LSAAERIEEREIDMAFALKRAVVIDDALGPPPPGIVRGEDKDSWGDYIAKTQDAVRLLNEEFFRDQHLDSERLIEALTSQAALMNALWDRFRGGQLEPANLGLLFNFALAEMMGKADKALLVVQVLKKMLGDENVASFADYESASEALGRADIAFVDFYLQANDDETAALARIAAAAHQLAQPKLVFFMSSQATLDQQQKVRRIISRRSAFFDVMRKPEISEEFLGTKIGSKRDSFDSNVALQELIEVAVTSTGAALTEFRTRCEELEVHDLRLLNLTRLTKEEEPLQEYLTWLFSEVLAAKTRKIAATALRDKKIEPAALGFSGQIAQGTVLFDLYSEVVFGPPVAAEGNIRFGEVLRDEKDPRKHYLALTPACDLQRCEPTKTVLCVISQAVEYNSAAELAKSKLFGKLGDGRLSHLLTAHKNGKKSASLLLAWDPADIATFSVGDLKGKNFARVALMNELFAQEVKEEVLRVLGRVGTQIDPPPPQAVNAVLSWKPPSRVAAWKSLETPDNRFISALLTYSADKGGAVAILSDEFKLWIKESLIAEFGAAEVPEKIKDCLTALDRDTQFKMGRNGSFQEGALCIRLVGTLEEAQKDHIGALTVSLLAT